MKINVVLQWRNIIQHKSRTYSYPKEYYITFQRLEANNLPICAVNSAHRALKDSVRLSVH